MRIRIQKRGLVPAAVVAVIGTVALYLGSTEGLAACYWAIAQGAKIVEAHMYMPGRSRHKPWDKLPDAFVMLRKFAEDMATMRTGVSEQFRVRWSA